MNQILHSFFGLFFLFPLLLEGQQGAQAAMTPITDVTIRDAVALWNSNRDSALAKYGHISLWDTRRVKVSEPFTQPFPPHSRGGTLASPLPNTLLR